MPTTCPMLQGRASKVLSGISAAYPAGNSAENSAGPFRERKASLYEGGIREPALIEWPGQIEPEIVVEAPCSTLDYMPTLAALLDVDLPDRPYDGINIMPILKGDQRERGKPIAFYFRDAVALSGDRYKVIASQQSKGKRSGGAVELKSKAFELFDLERDLARGGLLGSS